MRISKLVLVLYALLMAPLLPLGAACLAQSADGAAAGFTSNFIRQDLTVNGLARYFFYYLPTRYKGAPTSLVFLFHGGGGEALQMASNAHLIETAERNNFIAVAPQGFERHWNYGVKVRGKTNQDDVHFVNEMISYMQRHFNVDPHRIYVCGFSDGGWFTQWLTYQIPQKIAAAGVVCALQPVKSEESFGKGHPHLPIMFMLGTSDPRMHWDGGITPNGTEIISANATVHSWVRADDCFGEGRTEALPNTCTTDSSRAEATYYSRGVEKPEVVFYKIIGGGHAWPGAQRTTCPNGNVNEDIDGTQELWKFFSEHPKRVLNEPAPFPRLNFSE